MACIVFVSGVTGVGKTTALKSLGRDYPVFLEDTADNPHVRDLINHQTTAFDAARNQRWFLDRAASGIMQLPDSDLVFCDQAPEVIVDVYSAAFLADGLLTVSEFASLREDLRLIQRSTRSRWCDRIDVVFTCTPTVAAERLVARDGSAPPADWIGRCQTMVVAALREASPEFSLLDTTYMAPVDAAQAVQFIVKEQRCNME